MESATNLAEEGSSPIRQGLPLLRKHYFASIFCCNNPTNISLDL